MVQTTLRSTGLTIPHGAHIGQLRNDRLRLFTKDIVFTSLYDSAISKYPQEDTMAKASAIDTIRDLNQQMEKIKGQAREEALAQAEDAITILNSLGYDYTLVEKGAKPKTERKRVPSGGPCKVCGFITDPPHDGRVHRSQGENKRPFTKAELDDLGLRKVELKAD